MEYVDALFIIEIRVIISFLPVGASGYGHRKAKEGNGVLRYSCGQTQIFPTNPNGFYTDASTAPLFYDLYMRPGAIYWTEDVTGTGIWGTTVGWDINYFTFDFNRIYELMCLMEITVTPASSVA